MEGVEFELSEARASAKISAFNLKGIKWETLRTTASCFELLVNLVDIMFWEDQSCAKLVSAHQSTLIQISSSLFDINDSILLKRQTDVLIETLENLVNLTKEEIFYSEGAEHKVSSKRLERSRALRSKAIKIHGTNCKVCNFSFKDKYGVLGNGFIHIHHIERLADTGERLVNPLTDLIPVCPNCHAMLHKKTPPLLPQELIDKIEEAKSG